MKIKKISQSAGIVADVVDNLNSTSTQDALSANQGKLLNENKVNKNGDTIDGDLSFTNGHYIFLEAGDVFEDNTTSNTFKAIEKARVARDGITKYVEFGCGAEGAAVLEAQDEMKAVTGRLEVRQDGTIYNYKSDNKLMEEECVQLSASDFFETLNYNILDFMVYKCGNIINIQRAIVENIAQNSTIYTDIGIVKEEYRPAASNAIRTTGSTGGAALDWIVFLNGGDGRLALTHVTGNGSVNSNCYIFNIMYII